jgi:type I restriction enzyme, R subunit
MAEKEAKARIKINKLLEESGWSFFDTDKGKATIRLESSNAMVRVSTNHSFSPHSS